MSDPTTAPPGMSVVAHGVEDGIHWATCHAPIYGAVNGYAHVPEGHPWHGLGYEEIDVETHGGLTYSRNGWIGFDTLHAGDFWPGMPHLMDGLVDGDHYWTAEQVADETRELARQVAEAGR